jgi:hypothetical protein
MRVLATIKFSNFSSVMQSQQDDLAQWVDEILTGVWYYQVRYRNSGFSQLRNSPENRTALQSAAKQWYASELRRSAQLVRGLGIDGFTRGYDVAVQSAYQRYEA